MSEKSGIEWTDATWNPVTGCSKVSQGCKNCYAERLFPRVYGRDIVEYRDTVAGDPHVTRQRRFTDVRCHPDRLDKPLHWRKPRMVFVNSMSDLFHALVPDEFIAQVFGVMAVAGGADVSWSAQSEAGGGGAFHGPGDGYEPLGNWRDSTGSQHPLRLPRYGHGPHTFQILTKRPIRARSLLTSRWFRGECVSSSFRWACNRVDAGGLADAIESGNAWPLQNVYIGVSVEDQATADERIPILLDTPAAVRFVSYEPALGPVDFDGRKIGDLHALGCGHVGCDCGQPRVDWVIAGGESGPNARPAHPQWFRSVRDQCQEAGVPFFFKQWGEWAPQTHLTQHGRSQILSADCEQFIHHQPMYRVGKKAAGRALDGRTWDEMPLRIGQEGGGR